MMRLLITGAGGPAGQALVAQLRHRGLEVLGADMRSVPEAPVPVRTVPAATDPGYLPALRDLVVTEGIDVLIPTVSEELPVLAEAAGTFGHTRVLIGSAAAVRAADDKLSTALTLQAAGVPVPRFAVPQRFATGDEAVALWGGPIVVKPRISRGGRGVQLLTGADAALWNQLDEGLLVQEFAAGTEYAPVVFQPAPGGDIGADDGVTVVLEKVALAQGRVGNALAVRRCQAPDVAAVAQSAVRALGLTGPVDVDVRRDGTGRPLVLEVNARFGANSAAAPELLDAVLADLARVGADQLQPMATS